jgi:hypothetical protein
MSNEWPTRSEAEEQEGWGVVSRRALLKAGWTAPVILTVAPAVAFAASGSPQGGAANPGSASNPGTTGNPTSATNPTGGGNPGSTEAPAGAGGLPEQSSQGPQPARVNRGFTG